MGNMTMSLDSVYHGDQVTNFGSQFEFVSCTRSHCYVYLLFSVHAAVEKQLTVWCYCPFCTKNVPLEGLRIIVRIFTRFLH